MLATVSVTVALSAVAGMSVIAGLGVVQIVVIVGLSALPLYVVIKLCGSQGIWWSMAAWFVVFFGQVVMMLGISDAILASRGERVTATVVAFERRDGRGGEFLYTLAAPTGRELDGVLRTPNEHRVGSTVEVLFDPAGWGNPREAATIDPEGMGFGTLVFSGAIFVLPGAALYTLGSGTAGDAPGQSGKKAKRRRRPR